MTAVGIPESAICILVLQQPLATVLDRYRDVVVVRRIVLADLDKGANCRGRRKR